MSSQIEQLQNHYYQSLGLTAPDTNYHFYNNNYTRKLNDVERGETFLQEIFYSTTLSYLRKNKEFFIKNKNDPHFQGLMMLCVPQIIISTQNQEKLEFLLECGYNPNVLINKKAMYLNHENYKYPNGLVYSIEGLTPLHYFTSKPQLLILLKYGADPQKTSAMFNYLHDFIAQTGITKIKNLQELQQYIDFEFNYAKDHKEDTYFMETLGRHHYIYDTKNAIIYQSHIKTINHV